MRLPVAIVLLQLPHDLGVLSEEDVEETIAVGLLIAAAVAVAVGVGLSSSPGDPEGDRVGVLRLVLLVAIEHRQQLLVRARSQLLLVFVMLIMTMTAAIMILMMMLGRALVLVAAGIRQRIEGGQELRHLNVCFGHLLVRLLDVLKVHPAERRRDLVPDASRIEHLVGGRRRRGGKIRPVGSDLPRGRAARPSQPKGHGRCFIALCCFALLWFGNQRSRFCFLCPPNKLSRHLNSKKTGTRDVPIFI